MKAITVIKRDPQGKETWRYTARLVRCQGSALTWKQDTRPRLKRPGV